ncbi:MAG: RidA family protein [Pseudomonadota bacterium]
MKRYFQPTCMPESEAPFTQVLVDDLYAHLAGIVAADFPEGISVLGDANAETFAIMSLIKKILQELDLDFSDVVRTDVHLSDLDDFDAMDSAYKTFFVDGEYPARTTTESRRLFGDSKVEVTCMARLRT